MKSKRMKVILTVMLAVCILSTYTGSAFAATERGAGTSSIVSPDTIATIYVSRQVTYSTPYVPSSIPQSIFWREYWGATGCEGSGTLYLTSWVAGPNNTTIVTYEGYLMGSV